MIEKSAKSVSGEINAITLRFYGLGMEREYDLYNVKNVIHQSRLGISIGVMIWVLFSIFDTFITSGHYNKIIWAITFIVIALAIVSYIITLTYKFYRRFNQIMMMMISVICAGFIVLKIWLMPDVSLLHFFPALILVTMWTHCLSGLKFINACFASLVIILIFTVPFSIYGHMAMHDISIFTFYLLATTVLAAASSYATEKMNKELFLSQRILEEDRKLHLNRSLHDALTGLPNRLLLEDRLNKAISTASRDKKAAAAIFIDLDGFKEVNDTYGHDVGDVLLQQVAQRLAQVMRESDTLSRIGGDEFFVLAMSVKTKNSTVVFIEKLLKELRQPYQVNDKISIYGITASIGVCMFPYKGCSPADIMRRADLAMYQVKRDGKSGMAFAPAYVRKSTVRQAS